MKNITYINAGAGSGKTYRLTEEMVKLVKSGNCTPSQIIASTFTNDAAADLKKNAREKFLKNDMFSEAAELDSAAIGTVHSIGLQYIKKYWYKLGLSASVETITEDAKKGYLNRTMTKVVTDGDIAAFREYTETFGLKKPQSTKFYYDFWKSLVQKLVETADAFGINNLTVSETKSLELAQLLLGADGRFVFLSGKTNKSENELRDMYYDCIKRVFRIAKEWYVLFDQFKEEHGLIEFNDMESKFITLLEDKEVQAEISRTIKYVFVDEFQDSNPKQIRIFDLLSDLVEHSYWVGDPKQAIYGFRGCDTVLVQALTDKIIKEKGINGMDYDTLKQSRRSVKSLVDTTSAVFTNVFDDLDPEMVELTAYRTELLPDNTPALWHWEQQKVLNEENKLSADKKMLFKSIARQVRDMVDGKGDIKYVIDKENGEIRKVSYSDIAILARSNSDVNDITEALKAKDIPVIYEDNVDKNSKELRLICLLLNYMIDESPLLKAEIAHLLFGMKTEDVLKNKNLPSFGKLDDLKGKLKTLSVADVVKSLIIELDLFHRCQKWGKADQRQRNLQAIIEDAKTFDTNAETIGKASTIEHYLDHLDNEDEDVIVNKGFFQDGVQVLTYHKSKGLQWNVVILCSLGDKSLDEKTLKKRFAVGVNYVRMSQPNADQMYSDYYLTCLPDFFSSPKTNLLDAMLNDIETLGTYHRYAARLSYEARRLLYVGVTRARDYLITTSQVKSKMYWLLSSGINPVIKDTGDFQTIWGEGKGISESRFVKVADDGTYQSRPQPDKYSCRKEKTIVTEEDFKYLSPSKMDDEVLKDKVQPEVIYPVQDDKPHPIHVGSGDEYDIMGTCIHNIFAIYRPEINRTEMRNKAQQIVDAYKMNKMLPDVDSILDSINGLYQFLEKRYGKAEKIAHEVPFRNERGGQVVTGEMDLLWYTSPTECVLVDFKNYPGVIGNVLNKTKDEYVGKYAVQLNAYEEALHATGLHVQDKLIYYSVIGYVVRLDIACQ